MKKGLLVALFASVLSGVSAASSASDKAEKRRERLISDVDKGLKSKEKDDVTRAITALCELTLSGEVEYAERLIEVYDLESSSPEDKERAFTVLRLAASIHPWIRSKIKIHEKLGRNLDESVLRLKAREKKSP